MANISVRELLFDPDFVDPCVVVRSVEVVGEDGIANYVDTRFDILASIQCNGESLEHTPDMARTTGNYEIITSFPLVTATDTTRADTVLWNEIEFVLISVNRFGNFGGQYEGVMGIKTISPPPGA